MRGAGGLALILSLWAAPGATQDRPPETPPVSTDAAARPPQTPATGTGGPAQAPGPDAGAAPPPESPLAEPSLPEPPLAEPPLAASPPPESPLSEVADGARPPERPTEGAEGGDAPAESLAEPEPGDAASDPAGEPEADPSGDPSADSREAAPATEPAADPGDAGPVTEPAPADATGESPDGPAAQAQAFGPPPPPAWFTLAGDPARDAACRLALAHMGADFRPRPPVTDPKNRDCGIARPLQVLSILPGVALEGEPLLRCDTALALALWTRDFVQPAAATLPDAPRLTALSTGPGYTCRDRVGTGAADPKPSEHGYGNAVDVMGFVFGGTEPEAEPEAEPEPGAEPMPMLVQPRQGDGDPLESFQRAVQGTACLFFATVLGPGSNAAHDDHLHLDVAARNGGWRLCE